MSEYEFTVSDGKIIGESRVEGDTTKAATIPSDATFSVGTGTITETLQTDYGTKVLDFTQDTSNPSVYDLTHTSWSPSGQSGQSGHDWSGDGWSGDGNGSGHGWGGGHGLGGIDPGGPMEAAGVSDPVSAHGPGPAEVPGLETQIAQMHASGGSLI